MVTPTQEQLAQYIIDTKLHFVPKYEAYLRHINSEQDMERVHHATLKLENTQQFKTALSRFESELAKSSKAMVNLVENNILKMLSKGINTISDMLENSESVGDKQAALTEMRKTYSTLKANGGAGDQVLTLTEPESNQYNPSSLIGDDDDH